jgi:hypothetical protein
MIIHPSSGESTRQSGRELWPGYAESRPAGDRDVSGEAILLRPLNPYYRNLCLPRVGRPASHLAATSNS